MKHRQSTGLPGTLTVAVTGPVKFLITGIIFGAAAIALARAAVTAPDFDGMPRLIIAFMGALSGILAPVLLWMFFDSRKRGLFVDASSVPSRYTLVIVGILFTAVGVAGVYGSIVIGDTDGRGIVILVLWISSLIFLLPGLVSLATFLGLRLGRIADERIEAVEQNVGAILGGAVGIITLVLLLIIGGYLLVAGENEHEFIVGLAMTATTLGVTGFIALVLFLVRRTSRHDNHKPEGPPRSAGTGVGRTLEPGSAAARGLVAIFYSIGLIVAAVGVILLYNAVWIVGGALAAFGLFWLFAVTRSMLQDNKNK